MKVFISGGAGFIGCNAAKRFMRLCHDVTVLDNLSRPGSERNLEWLRKQGPFEFILGDVRDDHLLTGLFRRCGFDVAIHLAAQVAVTTSVVDPRRDFEINALGTINLLEAIRQHSPKTILLNASTNKVYGNLPALSLSEETTRYSTPALSQGISEIQPLDFHSPYGCSKGASDQYVVDYARIYGLRSVNFRQSCIYGYQQFGMEDQGWVAWFTIAHMLGQGVTIYGSGKQVRDILFIDDLIDCYLAAIEQIEKVAGMSFNIGGGPGNTLSLIELLELLGEYSGRAVERDFAAWRPGDQSIYISDIRKAKQWLSWVPQISVRDGLKKLYLWVNLNREVFESPLVAG